jgi:hypothetical protein
MHLKYREAGDMNIKTLLMQDLRFPDIVKRYSETRRFKLISLRLQRCCHQVFVAHTSSLFNDLVFFGLKGFVSKNRILDQRMLFRPAWNPSTLF